MNKKKKLRGEIEQVNDILVCIKKENPRHITELGFLARLNSSQTHRLLDRMLGSKLIVKSKTDLFTITEGGKQFMENYQTLIELLTDNEENNKSTTEVDFGLEDLEQ